MKGVEYATTRGPQVGTLVDGRPADPSAPIQPAGDGWRLATMAADMGWLYWSWEREARR